MSRAPTLLKLVAVNLALLCLGLVGIEFVMGDWFTSYVPPNSAIVDRDYVYDQALYDPPGRISYQRDKYGLRGVHELLPAVDIVTVGGSTTDQRYITEGETWQDVMRAAGEIRIANAGVDGMTSNGHLIAVAEWLHEIPGLAPKYFLHLVGVNDASVARADRGNYDVSGTASSWLRMLATRSALAKAFRRLRGPDTVTQGIGHLRIDANGDAPFVEVADDGDEARKYIQATYRPNLQRLIEMHRQRGEIAILVSQPANPQLVKWTSAGTLVSAQISSQGQWASRLRHINAATQRVCADYPETCRFIDLAGQVRFSPGDFYDRAHHTPAGARKIGLFLASALRAGEFGAGRRK